MLWNCVWTGFCRERLELDASKGAEDFREDNRYGSTFSSSGDGVDFCAETVAAPKKPCLPFSQQHLFVGCGMNRGYCKKALPGLSQDIIRQKLSLASNSPTISKIWDPARAFFVGMNWIIVQRKKNIAECRMDFGLFNHFFTIFLTLSS